MKKPGEDPEEPGEIETKTIDEVKPEPYNMPPGFEWCHVDVMDAAEAEVRFFGGGGLWGGRVFLFVFLGGRGGGRVFFSVRFSFVLV